jgi:hypothetical protein
MMRGASFDRVLSAIILISTTVDSAHAVGLLQSIALTDDAAPGGPAGAVFHEFAGTRINDSGKVEFLAAMRPGVGGVTEDDAIGIWTNAFGTLLPSVVGDAPAPGIPGARLDLIWTVPRFSDSGDVFAEFQMEQGAGGVTADNDVGGWLFSPSGDRLVYRDNGSLPGVSSDARILIGLPMMNAAGDVALLAIFHAGFGGITESNNEGLWVDTDSGLQKIVQSGDPAHGAPAEAVIGNVSLSWFNDSGVIASLSELRTGVGGVTTDNEQAIFSSRGGQFSLVYREGEAATGGAVFDSFTAVRANNENHLAFHATLKQGVGGVTSNNANGIWVETETGLRQVVRTNDIMPSTTLRFRSLANLVFNDAGRVAFTGSTSSLGVSFNTIYSEGIDGQLTLVARASTAAPGTSAGVNFDFDAGDFFGIPRLRLNNAGQVAFIAGLTGTGVTAANDMGLWAQDAAGNLKLVIRKGNQLEVAPGDIRTVTEFDFGGMNDAGQIVFDAVFTDNSEGVFVFNLAASLAGDFNGDGSVDAADYVAWRNGLGTTHTQDDYALWRANFGRNASAIAVSPLVDGHSIAVPEPRASWLLWSLTTLTFRTRRHTHSLFERWYSRGLMPNSWPKAIASCLAEVKPVRLAT